MLSYTCKINVTRILKEEMFKGEKGTYLDLAFFTNKDGKPDKDGNIGFVTQNVSKASREAGIKGPILGNWKVKDGATTPAAGSTPKPANERPLF